MQQVFSSKDVTFIIIEKCDSIYDPFISLVCKQWNEFIKRKSIKRNFKMNFMDISGELVRNNDCHLLKWMYQNKLSIDEMCCVDFCETINLETLQLIFKIRPHECTIGSQLIRYKRYDLLYQLDSIYSNYTFHLEDVITIMLQNNMENTKWIIEKTNILHNSLLELAMKNKINDVVSYLLEKDCPINNSTFKEAAERGFLNILEHHYNKTKCNLYDICDCALYNGSVTILDWIISKDIKYLDYIFQSSCFYHTTKIIDWFILKGKVYTVDKFKNIYNHGYYEYAKYLYTKGYVTISKKWLKKNVNNLDGWFK